MRALSSTTPSAVSTWTDAPRMRWIRPTSNWWSILHFVQFPGSTVFVLTEINVDPAAVSELLLSPYTVVGLSDGGAHVQFDSGVSFSTRLLGYWVREKSIMSLEAAVREITFNSASAFGIYTAA